MDPIATQRLHRLQQLLGVSPASALGDRAQGPGYAQVGGPAGLSQELVALDTFHSMMLPATPLSDAELDHLMRHMRDLREQALRDRAARGLPPPRPPSGEQQAGPVRVRAHGYEREGRTIPVREIRIFEVGQYRKRAYESFPGGWPDGSLSLGGTRLGAWYRAKVTWADGTTQEQDVRVSSTDGATLDIWHH